MYEATDKYHFFNWGELFYFDFDIIHNAELKIVANMDNYSKELFVDLQLDKDSLSMPDYLSSVEKDFLGKFDALQFERQETVIDTITQSYRRSAILSIYSIIEGQLKILIQLIQSKFHFEIKLKDINGNDYLNQLWIYLTKVFRIDRTDVEKYYTPLGRYRFIRNSISHNNCKIATKKVQEVNDKKGIRVRNIGSENFLYIEDSSFVNHLINSSQAFFRALLVEIDKRHDELNTDK